MQVDNLNISLDIKANKNIEKAWETFTGYGDLGANAVRKVISHGWLKSRELGIKPDQDRAQSVVSADEIEQRIRSEDLGLAGISVLEKLADILHDTQHVVVLADTNGQILYSIGHKQVQDELERINFRPGGAWSETDVGPNGVGTPIALGRPEVVMGYEHYCKGWHPWVCYGAPVYDTANHSIKGSVDITGPVKRINKEAMALAITVAQSVQSGLSIIQYHRREILREMGRKILKNWPDDGVIILDQNGFIVEYNSKAIKVLNLDTAAFLDKAISQLIPRLSGTFNDCFKSGSNMEINIHTERQSGILHPIKVRLEIIRKGKRALGLVMVMTDLYEAKNIKKSNKIIQKSPQSRYSFKHILGNSEQIKQAIKLVKAAATDKLESNVLLIGETGTGKELLAHSIHSASDRSRGPFVAVNCAAIPRDLIESELFGYMPGAFTGARKEGLKGKFELSHNGTLFLDEINSMNIELQSKLLRVLDCMEVTPIGSIESVQVNVRIISAANENIPVEVDEGLFRLDLFHRLNVLEIPIPPLSERGSDIIMLANLFLETECQSAGREKLKLEQGVKDIMLHYYWPGNVRELHNLCIRWVVTVPDDIITLDNVPDRLTKPQNSLSEDINKDLQTSLISDELIKTTLKRTNNNISQAARILGIDRTTIYRRRRNW